MPTNTCEFVVGRLLEIRVAAGYRSVEDIDEMINMIRKNVGKLPPSEKFAIAADWRTVGIMRPETAARARAMLMSVNPRVTRSAILTLPENPTQNLQVVRLIREAENESRRHFTVAADLAAWLSEVLSPDETARLRTFLGLPK
jgi:hypothetical protein